MAVSTKAGTFTGPTATGNFSVTGVGFTPKFVIFTTVVATSDAGHGNDSLAADTVGTDFKEYIGVAASSTKRWAQGFDWGNGFCVLRTDKCIRVYDGSVKWSADCVSMDADGFTLNFDTAQAWGSGIKISYFAVGGSDITNVDIGTISITGAGLFPVTGLGYQPDFVISSWSIYINADSDTGGGYTGLSFFDGDTSSMTHWNAQGQGLHRHGGKWAACYATNLEARLMYGPMNSDGFDYRSINTGATYRMAYLTVKGGNWTVGRTFSKTATGSQAVVGVGFQPAGVFLQALGNPEKSSGLADGNGEDFVPSFGAYDGSSQHVSANLRTSGNTKKRLYSTSKSVTAISSSAVIRQASCTSLDSDGFTLNWSTADSVEMEVGYFAVGSGTKSLARTTGNVKTKMGMMYTPASTGSLSVTGLGFQPKVVLFFANNASGGVSAPDGDTGWVSALLGMGISSSQRASLGWEDWNGAASPNDRYNTDACIVQANDGGTVLYKADLTSLDSDGFTLNFSTIWSGVRNPIYFLAIGGLGVTNTYIGTQSVLTTDTNVSVNTGFKPDMVLMLSSAYLTPSNTHGSNTRIAQSIGFCDKDLNQFASAMCYTSSDTNSKWQKTGRVALHATPSTAAAEMELSISAMSGNGFTIHCDDAPDSNFSVIFLAIRGGKWKVGTDTMKTSTGTKSTTGVGFKPKALLTLGSGATVAAGPSAASAVHLGMTDGVAAASLGSRIAPGAHTRASEVEMLAFINGGSQVNEASLRSFDSDGFTMGHFVADGTAREFSYTAIGNAAISGTISPNSGGDYLFRGEPPLGLPGADMSSGDYWKRQESVVALDQVIPPPAPPPPTPHGSRLALMGVG